MMLVGSLRPSLKAFRPYLSSHQDAIDKSHSFCMITRGYMVLIPVDISNRIEIEFQAVSLIDGVTTAGGGTEPYWVTSFKFQYSVDHESWDDYRNEQNFPMVFTGNADSVNPVTHSFRQRLQGRWFRVYPQAWHGRIGLRVEVNRCVECGDGFHDPSEGCDDGNTDSNDGCSHVCWKESEFQSDTPADDWCTPGRICSECVMRPDMQAPWDDPSGLASGTQTRYVDVRQLRHHTPNKLYFCPQARPIKTPQTHAVQISTSTLPCGVQAEALFQVVANKTLYSSHDDVLTIITHANPTYSLYASSQSSRRVQHPA